MPSRTVFQADALVWLADNPAGPAAGVVTSLPDVSEVGLSLAAWEAWFVAAARQVIAWTPATSAAVFFQSDVRVEDRIVDKGHLVMNAADAEGASLLWHKIVCRRPAGTISFGRPSWSHMLCVSHTRRPPARSPGPDVMDAGAMSWSRAMGADACRAACRYLRDEVGASTIVDPFCGRGTALAAANELGMDAIGVELSGKRCRAARSLVLP
ncbi:MAG: hypothetical protein JWP97_3506 [Labilithrix sp.]|nr:hypothetical protein [Labilithrix sp.]